MRHPAMVVPKGSFQICPKVCHVAASYHISAITPNNTADEPNTTLPYGRIFIVSAISRCYASHSATHWRAQAQEVNGSDRPLAAGEAAITNGSSGQGSILVSNSGRSSFSNSSKNFSRSFTN